MNIDHISCYCLYHNRRHYAYCKDCKQNICIECINENIHKLHDIILYKNIIVNDTKVKEIKEKIDIEKKNLDFLEELFLENINKIKTKFYNLFESKRDINKLKNILINEYNKKRFNYQMIMTCSKMEFYTKNLTILQKLNNENYLDIITLIFDTLNEKQNISYTETKTDSISKKSEKKKENVKEKENADICNNNDNSKLEKEILKRKKSKKKKMVNKIPSNPSLFSNELNNEKNKKQKIHKKCHSNLSFISNNDNKPDNILNITEDTKNNNKNITDINKKPFNRKRIISKLINKSVIVEKPKINDNKTDNNIDDDLLFFPKKSYKENENTNNKIESLKTKNIGENYIASSEENRGIEQNFDNNEIKNLKYKKTKLFKNKGNDYLKKIKLEEIGNVGEFLNYPKNNSHNNLPKVFKIKNKTERNIKDNNENTNNSKDNDKSSNNEEENHFEIENNNSANKEKILLKEKKLSEKQLEMIKKEFYYNYDDYDNFTNLNINLEKELKTSKENKNKSNKKMIRNVYLSKNNHKKKHNPISLNLNKEDNSPKNFEEENKMNLNLTFDKNTNNELDKAHKYSVDISNKKKNLIYNKKLLNFGIEKKKNIEIDKDEEADEEYKDLSFDCLNNNKKSHKVQNNNNNKVIFVRTHLIEKKNNCIDNNEVVNYMEKKYDDKERIFFVKINDDQVMCILSMSNNKFISVGLSSGIIRILNQKDFKQKLQINEHTGAINSMHLINKNCNCLLTSSNDKLIKKILISDDFSNYTVLLILKGHSSSVYKAIELNNNNIISCSEDSSIIIWENMEKKKNDKLTGINNSTNHNSSNNSNFKIINYFNDFLNIEKKTNNNEIKKNNINNNYIMNKKLNQMLKEGEIIYDILQIDNEIFVSSSRYDYLRFWNINSMTNIDTIKDIQCNDSHNCLCILNKTIMGVLLNEKNGVALIDYIRREVINTIIVHKNIDIKLSTILLTSNKFVVIGGQNNASKEESQIIYKFYKIVKIKKANCPNFKYSLKYINEHIRRCKKLLADDGVWLNVMEEGESGKIINGIGSTYINEKYGQIYIFYLEDKNLSNINKESRRSYNYINRNFNKI